VRGVSVTTQSRTIFKDRFDRRKDPHGGTYYWLTGSMDGRNAPENSDVSALRRGRISVTPLQFDLTDREFLPIIGNWKF
jgi:5'-nucleotidase